MRRNNDEIVRDLYQAFNRREVAAWAGSLDPGFEWTFDERNALQEGTVDKDTFLRYLEGQIELLDTQIDPEDVVQAADRLVAVVRVTTKGQASGVEVGVRNAHLWTFRDGVVVSGQGFAEPEKALAALDAA